MEKISPLEFLDYREYLLAFFEYRKANAPWYSYKVFGDGVGLDQSQVFRILQKNLHISKRALPRFVEYLKLNEKEAIYFEKLVELMYFCAHFLVDASNSTDTARKNANCTRGPAPSTAAINATSEPAANQIDVRPTLTNSPTTKAMISMTHKIMYGSVRANTVFIEIPLSSFSLYQIYCIDFPYKIQQEVSSHN